MTDLDGVRIKLAMARATAAQLDSLLRPVVDEARESIERVSSSIPGEVIYRIAKVPWIDPTWSAMFGQGIYNIRSALDHLAWQLVLLDGGVPNEYTQFPLIDTLTNEKGRKRHVSVTPAIKSGEIMAAIERLQPYRNGGKWGDQLGVVNELSRIDKHRLLLAVATMLNVDNIHWGLPAGVDSPGYRFPVGQPLHDGDEVARFIFTTSPVPDSFEPYLVPQVCLAEAPDDSLYRTQGLASLLDGLAKITAFKIDSEVMPLLFPGERPVWMAPTPP